MAHGGCCAGVDGGELFGAGQVRSTRATGDLSAVWAPSSPDRQRLCTAGRGWIVYEPLVVVPASDHVTAQGLAPAIQLAGPRRGGGAAEDDCSAQRLLLGGDGLGVGSGALLTDRLDESLTATTASIACPARLATSSGAASSTWTSSQPVPHRVRAFGGEDVDGRSEEPSELMSRLVRHLASGPKPAGECRAVGPG